jgi:hypothetical protein
MKDPVMKKTIAAVTAGLMLVAGQAFAAGQVSAVSRVGDRVGAATEDSSEFAGIPLIGIIAIAGVITAAVVIASDDDSESD